MILTDTGPLVALLDKDDENHQRCLDAAGSLPSGPLVTTWCCFTEAMYLLGRIGGYHYQAELWKLHATGRLLLVDLTAAEQGIMSGLMKKYEDLPMDLADASLVAVAEARGMRRVYAVDQHFRLYRLKNGGSFEVVP